MVVIYLYLKCLDNAFWLTFIVVKCTLQIKYEETVEKWKKAQSGKKRLEAKLLETKVSLQKVEREKASRINELMQEIGTLRGSVRNMEVRFICASNLQSDCDTTTKEDFFTGVTSIIFPNNS